MYSAFFFNFLAIKRRAMMLSLYYCSKGKIYKAFSSLIVNNSPGISPGCI